MNSKQTRDFIGECHRALDDLMADGALGFYLFVRFTLDENGEMVATTRSLLPKGTEYLREIRTAMFRVIENLGQGEDVSYQDH